MWVGGMRDFQNVFLNNLDVNRLVEGNFSKDSFLEQPTSILSKKAEL